MMTLIKWHNRFSENENEAVEAHMPRHRDPKTKISRYRDSRSKKPRHQYSETEAPRLREKGTIVNHDIVIPRHLFRGQKARISRFQDRKTTTSRSLDQKAMVSSFYGILTLMLPDRDESRVSGLTNSPGLRFPLFGYASLRASLTYLIRKL